MNFKDKRVVGDQNNQRQLAHREDSSQERSCSRLRTYPEPFLGRQTSKYIDELLAHLLDHYWLLQEAQFYPYMKPQCSRNAKDKRVVEEQKNQHWLVAITLRQWRFEVTGWLRTAPMPLLVAPNIDFIAPVARKRPLALLCEEWWFTGFAAVPLLTVGRGIYAVVYHTS